MNKKELRDKIAELTMENHKLNVILFHRENGLSHPDFKEEITKSKFAELEAELKAKDEELRYCQKLLDVESKP